MSDWLMKVIKAEAKHLIALAAEDDELRADLRALANAILLATETTHPESNLAPASSPCEAITASITEQGADTSPETREAAQRTNEPTAEPLRELTLGRSSPSKGDPRPVSAVVFGLKTTHVDLTEIEARCRRKAEAARWAAEFGRRVREGNDFPIENVPMDAEMVKWADRLTDCFYWVKASEASAQADLSLLDDVSGCFETVAEAMALVRGVLEKHPGNQKVLERSLPLIAEAQSALRAAFQRLGAADDPEQLEVFEWLKATAARHHVYLKRFMRADDLADPTRWSDLLARIESQAASGQLSAQHGSQIERIQDHVKRIQAEEETDHDWQAIIKTVDEMVGDGVPPSNREIRELLLPIIDDIPERDDLPDRFQLVLREIDRFLATRPGVARPSGRARAVD